MLEAQGLLAAVSNPPEQIQVRKVARGFAKDQNTSEYTIPLDYGTKYGVETFRFEVSRKTNVRAYSLYYVAASGFQSVRDYGLTDLSQAAWELMPYSFVADWFIPVGKWLEAISPKLGIITLAEGYTVESTTEVKRSVASHSAGTGSSKVTRSGSIGRTDIWRTKTKNRMNDLSILADFPPVNVNINVKRAIDAVALVTGISTRKSTIRI
jgi:hypothetical protein